MKNYKTQSRLKGFTLVELIVVISIIAMLLAVLMPALGRAQNQAKTMICKTNLKQLSMAHVMYLNQNNYRGLDSKDAGAEYWMTQLAPYLEQNKIKKGLGTSNVQDMTKQMKILRCPSTVEPDMKYQAPSGGSIQGTAKNRWRYIATTQSGDWKNTTVSIEGSYGMNGWVGGMDVSRYISLKPATIQACLMKSYIPLRADIPVFADSSWVDFYPVELDPAVPPAAPSAAMLDTGSGWSGADSTGTDGLGMWRICIKRHRMAINLGFADGHVGLVPLTNLWNYYWAKTFVRTSFVKMPSR